MDVLALGVLGRRRLGLDFEGMGTEVITLRLQEVGGEVLCPVTVEPREGSREGRDRDTEEGGLRNDVSPAGLGLVDGLVEEVVEEQVLEVGVVAVSRSDVLQEDRADNAAATPHEGDRRLVKFPAVLLSSLLTVVNSGFFTCALN